MSRHKTEPLDDICRRLCSGDNDTQYQAYLDALDLPVEDLLRLTDRQARHARADLRLKYMGAAGCVLWVLLLAVLPLVSPTLGLSGRVTTMALIALLSLSLLALLRDNTQGNMYAICLRLLAQQTDVRFVPSVLSLYDSSAKNEECAGLRQTLLRLMPHVSSADMREWTPAQRAFLHNRVCSTWGDLELLFCILETLARGGQTEAIASVRELAEMEPGRIAKQLMAASYSREVDIERQLDIMGRPSLSGDLERTPPPKPLPRTQEEQEQYHATTLYVKQKAMEALNGMRERAEQRQHSDILLRSAANHAAGNTELLRVAADTKTPAPNEHLLRPQ